jgi:YHS domain-containing protein
MLWQKARKLLIPLLGMIMMPIVANSAEPVSKNSITGIAFGGQDTVAYHKIDSDQSHKAVEGNGSWEVEWKGATWLFASKADRDLFAADPEKYSPAYNGFCANALSLGEGLFKTDGSHWQIFDDQLYTFYAARGRERWLSGDFKEYKAVADKAWKEIIGD